MRVSQVFCNHLFEQRGFLREHGTYATCRMNLSHERPLVAESPNYAECVKCGVTACIHCVLLFPVQEEESPWEEVTEEFIINVADDVQVRRRTKEDRTAKERAPTPVQRLPKPPWAK